MYQIFADDTLIYDSKFEDYRIAKGVINLEKNKSGSFVFSLYPDHFYYERFARLKTVITVYKSNKIIFRGRILNETIDFQNNKVLTCEGELGFLQDSIIRPFSFSGTPRELFIKLIEDHNAQVEDFKQFGVGEVTVIADAVDNQIIRENLEYESTYDNLINQLSNILGGYIYITREGDDTRPILNYVKDVDKVSSQMIEFGSNLKDYTKTIKADSVATVIIPVGATIDDGDSNTEDPRLTIESVNDGVDYVFSSTGIAMYGRICKVVEFDDVTDAWELKRKGEEYLESVVNHTITVELNAIDLHLLDRSIESFNLYDYIQVISDPHNFRALLQCNKQSIDLLKPENDTVVLGHTYTTLTDINRSTAKTASRINNVSNTVTKVATSLKDTTGTLAQVESDVKLLKRLVSEMQTEIDALWTKV